MQLNRSRNSCATRPKASYKGNVGVVRTVVMSVPLGRLGFFLCIDKSGRLTSQQLKFSATIHSLWSPLWVKSRRALLFSATWTNWPETPLPSRLLGHFSTAPSGDYTTF